METQFDAVQSLKSIESNYGPQVAREVVQIFINDYPGKIAKLKAAINEGNFEGIRFQAHDIKSGCLSMGVKPMSSICETIEREGSKMSKEELSKLADRLESDYAEISQSYGDYLNIKH
ncbi:Hpt domain-containing protein [Bdellovibrio sp. HCB337]|uniref:Hpt domain-containing protein n=1 Tax=Bdellovibrio sp. HCB337 TaxID=3394358 RepID=UPI0039A709EB